MSDCNQVSQAPTKLTVWNKTFICIMLAQTFSTLSSGSVNILVARYSRDVLGASPMLMGNLVGLSYAIGLAMRPISGPVQTRLNKRNLLIACYLVNGIIHLGTAFLNNTSAFVFLRVLQGIQLSFFGSLTMVLVADCLPRELMATGVAMYALGGSVANIIAPNVGIWLRDLGPKLQEGLPGVTLGYRFAFTFAAGAVVLGFIPLLLIPYKKEAATGKAETGVWYKNIVSIHAIPVTLVIMLSSIASSGYRNYLDPFASEVGIPNIGLFSSVTAFTNIFTRMFSGRLIDRYGIKKIFPLGMLLVAAAIIVIANSRTLPVILIGSFLSSVGNGFITPGLQAMLVQTETPARRAVASNTLYAGNDLALYLGPLFGGIVASYFSFSTTILFGLIPVALTVIWFFIMLPGYNRRRAELEA